VERFGVFVCVCTLSQIELSRAMSAIREKADILMRASMSANDPQQTSFYDRLFDLKRSKSEAHSHYWLCFTINRPVVSAA
jgi:hypothetical protein